MFAGTTWVRGASVLTRLLIDKGTIMNRLGAVLALFGFGSALLHFTDIQFRLLIWSEPWQPALGLIVGGVGVVFLLLGSLMNKDKPAEQQGAYGQPGYPPPAGYGPPPAGYGPPPASPPGGFAQPPAGVPAGYGPPPASPPGGFAQPPVGYGQPIPQQGPQFGQRPPQGPPAQRGPVSDFGPQDGPPFGPQGR